MRLPASLPLFLSIAASVALPGAARAADPQHLLAITVDDLPINGPDTGLPELRRINEGILAALVAARVPAVGFVNEAKLYRDGEVDGRIALLDAWLAAGRDLGNHTYSHPDLNKIGVAAYEEEVVRGETVTRLLCEKHGKALRLFRHTFLRTGKDAEDKAAFEAFLAARGYSIAPVTIENDDWWFNSKYVKAQALGDTAMLAKIGDAYIAHWTTMFDWYEALTLKVFKRPINHVILMHENALNAERLPEVLALMKGRGYAFATVEEVLKDPAYSHPDRYAGGWGKSWLQRWAFTDGLDTLGNEPEPPDWLVKLYEEK
jgi:peptidoglycan-N-acetylglucosamine deacetylase